jgi:hypothetical protein
LALQEASSQQEQRCLRIVLTLIGLADLDLPIVYVIIRVATNSAIIFLLSMRIMWDLLKILPVIVPLRLISSWAVSGPFRTITL